MVGMAPIMPLVSRWTMMLLERAVQFLLSEFHSSRQANYMKIETELGIGENSKQRCGGWAWEPLLPCS